MLNAALRRIASGILEFVGKTEKCDTQREIPGLHLHQLDRLKRNTKRKSLCWGFQLQGLIIMSLADKPLIQMDLRNAPTSGALWKVLSQQAIGILVRPALPRALRVAK